MSITFDELRTDEEKTLDEDLLLRVQQGIRTLEQKYGTNWIDKIDLDKLQLASTEKCVLGQVYGDYVDGCKKLGHPRVRGMHPFAAENGFTLPAPGPTGLHPYSWEDLNKEWRKQIAALRALR